MNEHARSRLQANARVAEILRETATLLDAQGANPFRVNAYRRAADTVAGLESDIGAYAAEDADPDLVSLPGIGTGIAATIREILRTGRSSRLDRLRGELDAEALFQTVPHVGPALAHEIHERLHVDTLEGLELAAQEGRLEDVPGIGPRLSRSISASLASMLGRRAPPARRNGAAPPVALLLEIDAEYRRRAQAGELRRIAPRRLNPGGEAWLPILHAERGDWHFTALYSNTATAHRLGRTRDWVVLYYYDGEHEEGQATVVTETRGALEGQRVVRGRERECARHYA